MSKLTLAFVTKYIPNSIREIVMQKIRGGLYRSLIQGPILSRLHQTTPDAHSLRSLDIIRDVIAKHNSLLRPIRAEGLQENVPVGLAADGRFSARSKLEGGHKWAGPERETGVRLVIFAWKCKFGKIEGRVLIFHR